MKTTILTVFALTCCASAGAVDIKLSAEQMDAVTAGSASANSAANAIGSQSTSITTFTHTFIGAPDNSASRALALILKQKAPNIGESIPIGPDDDGPTVSRSQSSSSANGNGTPPVAADPPSNLTRSQQVLKGLGLL